MKKRIIIILILCAAAIAAGLVYWQFGRADKNSDLILYGNVDIRQVDLGFRVGGRIREVLIEEGQKVESGQEMARLDTDVLEAQLAQARADLKIQEANLARLEKGYRVQEIAQARANVASARAAYENAASNLSRVSNLRKNNAVSKRDWDNAVAANKEAQAAWKSAQENLAMLLSGYREEEILAQKGALEAARAQLKKAEIQFNDAVLYAPQEGTVLSRVRESGAIVNEGQTVYTLTLTKPVWLRVYVSEPDLGTIKPGMPVQTAVDAAPGQTFTGHVGFISPTAEFTPKTVETREVRTQLMYMIRVWTDDPQNIMRQGMPVRVYISPEKK